MYLRVKDQIFIRKTTKGDYLLLGNSIFEVDEAAQKVLALCDGTHTFPEIVTILAEQTDETEEEIKQSVSPFVDMLKEENILITVKSPSFIKPVYDYTHPASINIEITYRCNEYCKFCASHGGNPEQNELTLSEIDSLLDELISLHVTPVTITGGEPLLEKGTVLHMASRLSSAGISPNLLTNGTLIDDKTAQQLKKAKIQHVQISLDGACAETNDEIRGRRGGFKEAIRGIKALKKEGLNISISTVLTKENFDEMAAIYKLGEELGVPLSIAPVSPTGRGFNQELLLTPRQIYELFCYSHRGDDGKISMLPIPRERCSIGTSPVVTPTGDVYPCMLTKYEPLKLGTIRESTLKEIWETSPLLSELYALNVEKLEPCKTCENKSFCGGGCRGHAFAYYNTIYKNDPYQCGATKLIVKEILSQGDEETKQFVKEVLR